MEKNLEGEKSNLSEILPIESFFIQAHPSPSCIACLIALSSASFKMSLQQKGIIKKGKNNG